MAQRVKTAHDVGGSGLLIADPREDEARAKESSRRADASLRASMAAQFAAMMAPAGQRGGTPTYGGESGDISVGKRTADEGHAIASPWNRPDDRPQGVSPGRTIGDNSANNPWAQAMGRAFGGSNPAMNSGGGPAQYDYRMDQGGFGMNASNYPGEKDKFGNTLMSGSPTPWANVVHDAGLGFRPNMPSTPGSGGQPTGGAPGGSAAQMDPMEAMKFDMLKEQVGLQKQQRTDGLRQQVMSLFGDSMTPLRNGEGLSEESVAAIEQALMAQPELKPIANEILQSMGAEKAVRDRFSRDSFSGLEAGIKSGRTGPFKALWEMFRTSPDAWSELTGIGETAAGSQGRALEQLRRLGFGTTAPQGSPSSFMAGPGGDAGYQGPGEGFKGLGPGQEMGAGALAFRAALLKRLLAE